jgi:GNAT superfamily N-acetyltransferase
MPIRVATPADIPEMIEIRLSVRENTLSEAGIAWLTHERVERAITQQGRGWVAETDGEIEGFCIALREDASIWAMFVRPRAEDQGFGRRLLARAAAWLFDSGAELATVTTDLGTRAAGFYAAVGWQQSAVNDEGEVTFLLHRRPQ